MRQLINREPFVLIAGDIVVFVVALYTALVVRYGKLPSLETIRPHIVPFALLFIIWIVVFFVFNLYGRQTSAFRRRIVSVLFKAQILNTILAIIFFYVMPFVIEPKTTLGLDITFSFMYLIAWRLFIVDYVYSGKTDIAAILGDGPDVNNLTEEISSNRKYRLQLIPVKNISEVENMDVRLVIADLSNPATASSLTEMYPLVFKGVRFLDTRDLYEQIFDRVPLSLLEEGWFLKNVTMRSKKAYDVVKRITDIVISVPLFLVSLLLYPFVILAIKMEDGGPIFVTQTRIGRNNKPFQVIKFRSMTGSDVGIEVLRSQSRVTRVGAVLRKTRLDELPQLIAVLTGDLSLVGPRPELPALADVYRKEIPYYDIRHLIKPGLSGWAQIYHDEHPHHGTAVAETKNKLSYDLFYLKHRSVFLDLKIALKTVKKLLDFAGK